MQGDVWEGLSDDVSPARCPRSGRAEPVNADLADFARSLHWALPVRADNAGPA